SLFSIRITAIREPGAAWTGRTEAAWGRGDADAQADNPTTAQAARRSATLRVLSGSLDAVERLEDEIGRVAEVERHRRVPVLHRLEHRSAELTARGAQLPRLSPGTPGERPAAP